MMQQSLFATGNQISPSRPLANHQRINQNSGDAEWYTPPHIIESARRVLGNIDLDPASCAVANANVKAAAFFTADDNGLRFPWHGRVWLNMPFGGRDNEQWIGKLIHEYTAGRCMAALTIAFSSTDTKWCQMLLDYPVCFIRGRVAFIDSTDAGRDGPPKGALVAYLGPDVDRFTAVFSKLGSVMIPAKTGE